MAFLVKRLLGSGRAWLLAALMAVAAGAGAQGAPAGGQGQTPSFKPEEIEALVAPIALYPDSVLSQVLMASTYPLEIVHAARWLKANPGIKGDAAVKAVADQPWDVSVKSLVAFPQALEPMNDKLDWTQKLGDAFLAQEKDVLAAVQRLRARAQQSGNLKSTEQQTVIVEPATSSASGTQSVVRIEPADPQVIYVPAYNPTVVYGAWSYPAYPPYYWPPYPAYYPGAALATGLAWGVGLAAAGAIFGNCNWGGGDVNINVNRATNIDRNFDRTKVQAGGRWQHDASHRQGVAYRDNATREKFSRDVPGADRRNDFRGREGGAGGRGEVADRGQRDRSGGLERTGGGERAALSDRPGGGDRGGVSDRAGVSDRSGVSDRAGASDRSRGGGGGGGRDNAFQGVGGGAASQRDFDRGRSSMQSAGAHRGGGGFGGGGGGRGGGGFGGGGRGGRR